TCQINAIVRITEDYTTLTEGVLDKRFGPGFYLAIVGAAFHIVPLLLAVIVAVKG
ncbi:hypothetical protein HK104_003209, partial [Borealophlyctis nickersoniae]